LGAATPTLFHFIDAAHIDDGYAMMAGHVSCAAFSFTSVLSSPLFIDARAMFRRYYFAETAYFDAIFDD